MRPLSTTAACLSLVLMLGAGGTAALAATAATKTAAPAAKAGAVPAWSVDKAASRLGFKSAFSGTAFDGRFSRWDAQIAFDPKNLAGSKVAVSIDLTSVATGDADRDQTLPTADWFNTSKFPRATFNATSFKDLGGGKYQAAGTLALKGVSKPVVLPFTLAITGDHAKMNGSVVLKRNDFKIGEGQFAGADTVPFDVTVTVAVDAKRG